MSSNRSLIIIGLFVIIDVLGFSLILPLLPYLTKQFAINAFYVGILQSCNSVAQLISVPFIGSISDNYGRKPVLLFCIFGTFVSFVMFGMAETYFMLVLSRVLDGAIGGNISLAKSYVTDVTTKENRSKGLGIIGASFGIGFIFGPAMGGILMEYDHRYPSYLAAVLSLINFFLVLFFLEETKSVNTTNITPVSIIKNVLKDLKDCLSQKNLRTILFNHFTYMLIFTLFECSFSFFSIQRLNLEPRMSSYLLVYFGIFYASVQGSGIKRLTKRMSEDTLLRYSLLGLAVSFVIYMFIPNVPLYMVLLVPLSMFNGIANTLLSTKMSHLVEPRLVGGAFGLSAALGSMTRIISPAIGGYLIDNFTISSPYILCAILSLILYINTSTVSEEKE
eukprot:TRINITY_DN6913_c0_g1_i1.p1 TRINITY_DN6913_c0_g1~~TRINITY_DN6913_c0_g1_i1.p1  ORF type:complete len:391 (+),score=42.56 TRINITY_DN6913_c0_g1_i1:107-1279(+)